MMGRSAPLRFVFLSGLPSPRVRADARTASPLGCSSADSQTATGVPASLRQIALILLCTLGICPSESTAQAQASLIGTVTDETGAVIADATISIRHTSTNLERRATTNNAGRYQLAGLDVGTYRVVVRGHGFRSHVVEDLKLEVGRTAVQDFVLTVGGITERDLRARDLFNRLPR
jgi:hypothetical protein